MEKLPVHNRDRHEGSRETEWATSSLRRGPDRATYLRRIVIAVCFFIGYYILIKPTPTECTSPACTQRSGKTDGLLDQTSGQDTKPTELHQRPPSEVEPAKANIPLEVHIMSKCPDAQECLHDLVLPAMEKISDKVDFKLSFIAR